MKKIHMYILVNIGEICFIKLEVILLFVPDEPASEQFDIFLLLFIIIFFLFI